MTDFVRHLSRHLRAAYSMKLAALIHQDLDERISARGRLADRIAACAVDGKIWVAQSGRDCDCSQYQYAGYQIEASARAYWAEYDRIADWADGPFSLTICAPDNIQQAAPSRDLALEAFEDGHQHIVYA